MPAFVQTPYDGSARPFSIGLARLDLARWIEPDEQRAVQHAEKARLLAEHRQDVFAAEAATHAAQAEVLALIADHVTAQFPDLYRRQGDTITVADRAVPLNSAEPPLVTAARLVQEDLCLMRRDATGYRLVAGVVCFPSSWSIGEKIGKSLISIHAPVPGYAEQLSVPVDTIFAKLRTGLPLRRINWSIYPDAVLHHPVPTPRPAAWLANPDSSGAFLRIERQTLRRLPGSGDILFTIKIMLDPLDDLRRHPDGARLALSLKQQILALTDAQLDYKSMRAHRDRMVRTLEAIARGCAAGTAPV